MKFLEPQWWQLEYGQVVKDVLLADALDPDALMTPILWKPKKRGVVLIRKRFFGPLHQRLKFRYQARKVLRP